MLHYPIPHIIKYVEFAGLMGFIHPFDICPGDHRQGDGEQDDSTGDGDVDRIEGYSCDGICGAYPGASHRALKAAGGCGGEA